MQCEIEIIFVNQNEKPLIIATVKKGLRWKICQEFWKCDSVWIQS